MKHTRYYAVTAAICILSLLFQVLQVCAAPVVASAAGNNAGIALADDGSDTEFDYEQYDEKYRNVKLGTETLELLPETEVYMAVYENKTCAVDDGETPISFRFRLEQEARYIISVEYYTVAGNSNNIERELKINGAIPFAEAQIFQFNRVYQDSVAYDNGFEFDDFDNEVRPFQTQTPCYQEAELSSNNSYFTEPFSFYFPAGENTITFSYIRESFAVSKITLKPEESLPSYSEVKKEYDKNGHTAASGNQPIKIQAENTYQKSTPSIYPISDRTSAASEPFDPYHIRLNTIGSSNWKNPGEWISWKVTVPESGLYRIALRQRQNLTSGSFVFRKLYIDNQVPFAEAKNLQFAYNAQWQCTVLGNDDEAFEFYFEAGKTYELKLEVTIGDMSEILREAQTSIRNLNYVYRQILMITGVTPDQFRDYHLGEELKDSMELLSSESLRLQEILKKIQSITGTRGSFTSVIEKTIFRIDSMVEDPDTIPKTFVDYQNCIIGMSSWMITAAQQTLELDYIALLPADCEVPRAAAGFWRSLAATVQMFISSFISEYDVIGNYEDGTQTVTAWIGTGRDQAQIIKQLADSDFTEKTGIVLNLKLVAANSLLPAVLSNKGPDLYLSAANTDPMNYAIRNSLYDLASFSDYKQIASRFLSSALVPYTYGDKIYALPETQTFPLLFYRTDIMEELGLKVPQTWDDVIDMLSVLQKNNMSFALPAYASGSTALDLSGYGTFLYQMGGSFFTEDAKAVAIDSEIGINAFEYYTSFYTTYSLEYTYDFATRFRMGDKPIGIADYTMYNTLSVSAPEINGLWDFTVIPGTKDENGTINRSAAGNGTCTMMLAQVKNPEAGWEFLKWWSSADVQTNYGRELETIMGVASRYAAANTEALHKLPWLKSELEVLDAQREWVVGVPEVPGGYLKDREISFAVRATVRDGENAREALLDHTGRINEEITKKRKEFNMG